MKEPNVPQIITHEDIYRIAFIGLDWIVLSSISVIIEKKGAAPLIASQINCSSGFI